VLPPQLGSVGEALSKSGTPESDSIDMCEQIMVLADEVLLGIAGAYERAEVI